jgi:hypothetical protein
LTELKLMLDEGLLTDEEYKQAKTRALENN